MANSKRKCGFCGGRKPAESMLIKGAQAFCDVNHWIENQVKNKDRLIKKGREIQAKEERKETKRKKEAVKTLSEWKKDAQFWFNKFIRLRDKGKPCCSCHKPDNGQHQRHASHYRSVGACSSMRYHEENVWASCSVCNNYLSGNLAEYRIRLIKNLGIEKVEWIESQPKSYKWTVDELKEIIKTYKAKCKQLDS